MLEKIMYEFINGEIDVLISTTIIETGVDISNVNTMIIEDADKFGLSHFTSYAGVSDEAAERPMHFYCTAGTECSRKWQRNG